MLADVGGRPPYGRARADDGDRITHDCLRSEHPVLDLADEPEVLHLRVSEDLVQPVHGPARDADGVERLDPVRCRPRLQSLGDAGVQLGPVRRSLRGRVEPRVADELGEPDGGEEVLEEPPPGAGDVDDAVGRAEAAHRHQRRVVVALLDRDITVDRPASGLEVHHPDHRLEKRRLHPPPLAGPLPVMQRHEDADGQVKPRRQVGDGDPDPGGLGAGHSRHAHQPAHALGDLIDPTALSIGSVLPEAGDRAVDEARVANVDRVVVETEPLLHRRTHVLDEDVGGLGQAPEDIATSLRLEVDGDGALVAMQVLIVGAMAALAGDPGAVRFSRRLDSYDVGAPVGELPDAGRPSARRR